jgi:hypothetical protein
MTDDQVIGFVFLAPIFLIALAAFMTRKADKGRDWVAERHRKIARNGFKSRIGAK